MQKKIDEIEALICKAAARFVPSRDAAYYAGLYMEAHLRRSPRLNPIEEAVADIKGWKEADRMGGNTNIRVDADKGGVLVLDFGGLAPGVKLKYVHDELETRCRKNGIAAVGFRNSSGIITLLPWAFGLAERDLIGLAMFNGGVNCCVPFGGTRGFFGTLPFAYALPSEDEPIVSDMAMTEIPFFQLKNAKENGEPLPPGSAVDHRGVPTKDAAEALDDDGNANLLPFGGGFKGYGLAVLVEILTGSLVRSLLSNRQTAGWYPSEYGALIIAIDIGSFTDIHTFKNEVSQMCRAIRRQQPAQWASTVAIPGDRGGGKAKSARLDGKIDVQDEVMEQLEKLAV